MLCVWSQPAFAEIHDYDSWEPELCEDEDIIRHIQAGHFVPINIGSDGVSEVELRVGSAGERAVITDRESKYLTDAMVLPLSLTVRNAPFVPGPRVMEAIAAGKHVVTANKALLAVHGTEIFAAAREKGVMVAFEAAVAGGIPIIKARREGLTANRIEWIAGIINGTTNYILSEMRAKGLDFAVVLKEAQRLGYAETDPTFDIEGIDAAHKATIVSAIAFGIPVQFDKAYVEGITKLQAADITYAEQLGYRIKLLGITRRRDTGIELRVHPTLVPSKRLIANVEGAMNAVVVHGDAVGTTLHYGLLTVFVPALSPVPTPMKLFVICAGAMGNPVEASGH
jgi:homoserine dehydrogenase